jgi:flagellar biosynthesis/type III secretory pathway protein FliH
MDGGLDMLEDAEQQLYNDKDLSVETKADLLTAMAIFTGMRDKELAQKLIERRRDIMIESPIYDIIKEEGMKEGMKEGVKEGSLKEGREMILTALDEKFGKLLSDVSETLSNINDIKKLEILLRQAIRSGSLKEFSQKLDELSRSED